jgi:hypothetical protein
VGVEREAHHERACKPEQLLTWVGRAPARASTRSFTPPLMHSLMKKSRLSLDEGTWVTRTDVCVLVRAPIRARLILLACILGSGLGVGATPAPAIARRCAPSKMDEGRARLRELEAAVRSGDVAATRRAWAAVQTHACFRLASAESPRPPRFEEGEPQRSLWWWSHGGKTWLESYVTVGSRVVLPPDWPPVLRPPRRLICATSEAGCGAVTAQWVSRANDAFAVLQRNREREEAERDAGGVSASTDAGDVIPRSPCDEEVTAEGDAAFKYRAWRKCLENRRPRAALLPLAQYRVPLDGWFVFRGRRGHYDFCDEIRAYDLATGAAYVGQSCSALALREGGSVDHDQTDAARRLKVVVGHLSVDKLREAAWMTIFANEVVDGVQASAWTVALPPSLDAVWRASRDDEETEVGSHTWGSSAQTQLAWSWHGPDGLRASGSLTWPDSSSAGEEHALELLRAAEASLVEGCPPAPFPDQQGSLDATEARLVKALSVPRSACP